MKDKEELPIRILAVIPSYNVGSTIGNVVSTARKYVSEVLVVNDGSIDNTVRSAQLAGATVVSHPLNRGKSSAIRTGFSHALQHDFDYLVTLDGDGQHDPDEIPRVLDKLVNNGGSIDVSIGFRSGSDTEMPAWRKVGKRVLDYSTGICNGGTVTDSQCGFRAFSRRAVQALTPQLKGKGFSVESEQLIKAHNLGLGLAYSHVSCKYEDLENTSTKHPAAHAFSVLVFVLKYLLTEKRPMSYLGCAGVISLVSTLLFSLMIFLTFPPSHALFFYYVAILGIFLIGSGLTMLRGWMPIFVPRICSRMK